MNPTLFLATAIGLGALTLAAQQPKAGPPAPGGDPPGRSFSGRVVDGLGRPVASASVSILLRVDGREESLQVALRTDDDGRFAAEVPRGDADAVLSFEKEGYGSFSTIAPSGGEFVLRRKVAWGELALLPVLEGEKADGGVREALASEEWGEAGERIQGYLFHNQDEIRPALRRLVNDAHVGDAARDWLDLLDDPDVAPAARRYAPKEAVQEDDLVEAIRAAARRRNFFTSKPEPQVAVDSITLTKGLDRAFVVCGINRIAMTGITWQFVFRKAGRRWELRSAREAGRS